MLTLKTKELTYLGIVNSLWNRRQRCYAYMAGRTKAFSLLQSVQIICRSYRLSYKMDTCFSEAKRSGLEAYDYPLPPSITEVKNMGTYTSMLPCVFKAWCLIQNSCKFTYAFVCNDGRDCCLLTG
jgi:hypothetical protein